MKVNDIFVCSAEDERKCDYVVEALQVCDENCRLSCCGVEMKAAEFKTADQGSEKHVPVIEKVEGGYKVKVGDVPHPMLPEHYIQFIELRTGDEVLRKHLKPGAAPEALFKTEGTAVSAIELCNLHGIWKK